MDNNKKKMMTRWTRSNKWKTREMKRRRRGKEKERERGRGGVATKPKRRRSFAAAVTGTYLGNVLCNFFCGIFLVSQVEKKGGCGKIGEGGEREICTE